MLCKYLDRREAAQYLKGLGLKISKNTLDKMATVGGGPVYQRFGNRAVYLSENLDLWVASKLSPPKKSTSDAP